MPYHIQIFYPILINLLVRREYIVNPIAKALTLFEQHHSEQAIELLNSLLTTATDEEKFQIAQLFLEFGLIQHAKEILLSLHQEHPQNSHYKTVLADIYIELEEDDKAFDLLHHIDSNDPAYIQSLIQLADLYQAQGLYEVAEQKLYEAKRFDPNEKIIDFALAEFLFSIGKYDQCIDFYKRLLSQTVELGGVSLHTRLAEAYAAIGQYEKAFEYFQQDHDKEPDILFKYGLTAYHINRKEVAISAWEQLMELDPHYYALYYYLGKAYKDEGMFEEAYHIVTEGLRYDEHNHQLYYLAANLAYHNGNLTESESFIVDAIKLDPDDQKAILFYIKLLTESGRFEEIIQLIKNISHYNVYDPFYEWELARAHNELDEIEQAILHYDEAFNSLQNDVDFLQEYGLLLAENGRSNDAIHVLQQYLQLEPMDEDILEYVNRLSEL